MLFPRKHITIAVIAAFIGIENAKLPILPSNACRQIPESTSLPARRDSNFLVHGLFVWHVKAVSFDVSRRSRNFALFVRLFTLSMRDRQAPEAPPTIHA